MFKIKKSIKSDRGISLVEVVASIVIIGIILISFFGLFIQSNKTGKASETILDSTYVAQLEIESLHALSKNNIKHTDIKSTLSSDYALDETISSGNLINPNDSLTFKKSDSHYTLKIKFKKMEDKDLIGVVVEVYDSNTTNLKAKMENIFIWKVA